MAKQMVCVLMPVYVCRVQYFDYVVRVLMPEMLVKIVVHIYHVTQDEAEKMLLAEPPDNYDDWYGRCRCYCGSKSRIK